MNDWVKRGREIAEYIKQLETERDNWMEWCKSAELETIYLRGKLDTIRQEADIRQGTKRKKSPGIVVGYNFKKMKEEDEVEGMSDKIYNMVKLEQENDRLKEEIERLKDFIDNYEVEMGRTPEKGEG